MNFQRSYTNKWQSQNCQTPKVIPGLLPHQIDWGCVLFYLTSIEYQTLCPVDISSRTILLIASPGGSILVLSAHPSPPTTLQLPLPPRPLNTDQARLVCLPVARQSTNASQHPLDPSDGHHMSRLGVKKGRVSLIAFQVTEHRDFVKCQILQKQL